MKSPVLAVEPYTPLPLLPTVLQNVVLKRPEVMTALGSDRHW